MENTKEVIRLLTESAVEEIFSLIAKDLKKLNFSEIVQTTQKTVNNLGVNIVGQIVKIIDETFNNQRDKHAVILRHTKTRKMISGMGELNLTRRLYFDKATDKYFFAVDELLNMEKYSRIEGELKTKLINDATLTSYGKASKLSNGCVSRQTVHNLVHGVSPNSLVARYEGIKKVNELYIEADEDHIHLNNGKSAEVKLVYVHEGRRKICQGRTELINAKYFTAVRGGTDIWNSVADYVCFQYDVPRSSIKISGDGAAWIKSGLDFFFGAQYIIDKFHVYKSVTDASAGSLKFRKRVIDCIKRDDKNAVHKLYATQLLKELGRPQQRRMADSLTYIENNFDDIDLLSEYGCSAEGHISHVLSERMSSRPMAWSIDGAEKMAKLRAFYFNGGKFADLYKGRIAENCIEEPKKYNVLHLNQKTDHSIPRVRIVGLEEIYDEVGRFLRFIIKK